MKKEIHRAIDETLDGIAYVLREISKCLMSEDGGEWVNSREAIDYEINDLIQTIERVEE